MNNPVSGSEEAVTKAPAGEKNAVPEIPAKPITDTERLLDLLEPAITQLGSLAETIQAQTKQTIKEVTAVDLSTLLSLLSQSIALVEGLKTTVKTANTSMLLSVLKLTLADIERAKRKTNRSSGAIKWSKFMYTLDTNLYNTNNRVRTSAKRSGKQSTTTRC